MQSILVFKFTETLNLNTTILRPPKIKEKNQPNQLTHLPLIFLEHQVCMNNDSISVINQNMQYDERFVQFTIQQSQKDKLALFGISFTSLY